MKKSNQEYLIFMSTKTSLLEANKEHIFQFITSKQDRKSALQFINSDEALNKYLLNPNKTTNAEFIIIPTNNIHIIKEIQ